MDGFCTARAPACCHQRVPPGGVGRAPVLPPMTGVKRKVAGNGSFTTGRSQHRTCIMEEYNPGCAPEPESWLELDEQERIALVETYHRVARIKLPNVTAHAALHAIVENQIALNLEPVVRAMDRLGKGGLTRHDAVHAIGSVVAEHLFDILKTDHNDDAATSQARYYAAVERLTAASWRRGEH